MRVLITGISSGLGNHLAREALANGWEVFGLARRKPENLEDSRLHFKKIDLENLSGLEAELKGLVPGVMDFDLVILNAGILGEIRDLRDTSIDSLKNLMDINLWSNKIILDFLLNLGCKLKQVVAISSGAAVSGQRGWSGYGISKAALNMLIKLYASENPQIHFISLAPGLVQTAMQDIIAEVTEVDKFPVVQRLTGARGTADMPLPDAAAKKIWNVIPGLLNQESGSFIDVRKI